MNNSDLIRAHATSFANRTRLQIPQKCGCYYCLKIFDSSEIDDWSADKPDWTVLCPYCWIDAVVGENDGFPITEEFLEAMNEMWFGEEEIVEGSYPHAAVRMAERRLLS